MDGELHMTTSVSHFQMDQLVNDEKVTKEDLIRIIKWLINQSCQLRAFTSKERLLCYYQIKVKDSYVEVNVHAEHGHPVHVLIEKCEYGKFVSRSSAYIPREEVEKQMNIDNNT